MTLFVRHGRLHYFCREVLKRLRLPAPHASKVGDVLIAADLAGVEGEGIRRLPYFASRVSAGVINPTPAIRPAEDDQATAVIDGDNGMGHVVAIRSMELAIEKAKQFGIAAVAARRSNDFGMAGYYARLALAEQMIGIAVSNAVPAMLPTYGTKPMLGSNPIAIAVPGAEEDAPFVLDMATTATSRSELEDAVRRRDEISLGLALDVEGKPTKNPKAALEAMSLLPLGSRPETGSYKGFGLGLAVDILSGLLAGGAFGRHLASETSHRDVADVSHFFIAIRVKAFTPWVRFRNRLHDMTRELIGAKAEGAPRVYYPGEAEYAIEQERRSTGIPIDPDVQSELEGLARRLDIHDAWKHLVEGKK